MPDREVVMKVSCLCPTFGRFPQYGHLVEEAVECFRRQDYPDRELILCNDCIDQTLVCEVPGVRVINLKERIPTLGQKYNVMASYATGEVLMPWEDDDLSLSWRISLSVKRMTEGNAEYFNPKAYWFWPSNGTPKHEQLTGYAHNASAYTRRAFTHVGGYPPLSGPQDAAMDGMLFRHVRTIRGPLGPRESFYVYRWGVSDLHLSAFRDTERVYTEHGRRVQKPGEYVVLPRWRTDYEHYLRSLCP